MMHFNFQNIYILNLYFVIFILSSVIFYSQGRSNGYISMGLSKDNTMGDDLTTNCVINTSGQVDINTGEEREGGGREMKECVDKVITTVTPGTRL